MATYQCTACGCINTTEKKRWKCYQCGKFHDMTDYFLHVRNHSNIIDGNYQCFFNNVSLEKFRRIANRLSHSVTGHSKKSIIILDNGTYFEDYPDKYKSLDSYCGEFNLEHWYGVEYIQDFDNPNLGFRLGITGDGEIQSTLIDIQEVIDRIKESGISDMRMKQVVSIGFDSKGENDLEFASGLLSIHQQKTEHFLGLDLNGKVVMTNPSYLFDLPKGKDLQKICAEINALPPLKELRCWRTHEIYGITEDGKVRVIGPNHNMREVYDEVEQWENIVDVIFGVRRCVGLKENGSVICKGVNIDSVAELTNVVQIHCDAGKWYMFLLRNGDLMVAKYDGHEGYMAPIRIARNVVALCDNGVIFADGTIMMRGAIDEYKPVEGIKLFDNIETIEEDWQILRESHKKGKRLITQQIEQENQCLDSLKDEMRTIPHQRSALGMFKFKEKQQLALREREIQSEIEEKEKAVKQLKAAYPTGRPVWRYKSHSSVDLIALQQSTLAVEQILHGKTKKNASVLKSAAVGGVVAGPAGAIVGAIYAADKNNKKNRS